MFVRQRHLPAGLLMGLCTAVLAAATWAAARAIPAVETPLQVATTLDSIVQPRFQANAGRFGIDRVIVDGHDDVYDLDTNTVADRSKLNRVKQSRRPFIIAFLHCTHKPGHSVGVENQRSFDGTFTPSVDVLAAGTETEDGTNRLYDWGEAHLGRLTIPHLPRLRRGLNVKTESSNWLVAMRPVRATRDSCLGCHEGAKRNDTLGVMVYAVDKNVNHRPIKSLQAGFR